MNIYSSFQSFSFFISSNFNFPIHPNIFVCVYHCQEYVCNHSFHPYPSTTCFNFCPGYYLNVIFRSTFVRVFGVKSKINRIKCPEFNFYVNKLPLSLFSSPTLSFCLYLCSHGTFCCFRVRTLSMFCCCPEFHCHAFRKATHSIQTVYSCYFSVGFCQKFSLFFILSHLSDIYKIKPSLRSIDNVVVMCYGISLRWIKLMWDKCRIVERENMFTGTYTGTSRIINGFYSIFSFIFTCIILIYIYDSLSFLFGNGPNLNLNKIISPII